MVKDSRRTFLFQGAAAAGGACLAAYGLAGDRESGERSWATPASYFEKLPGKRVECTLCPQKCRVADQERGTCGVRENRGGSYFTLVHSRVVASHADPIEKKPLFHFLPGTRAFSLATAGCNMVCRFCQNWNISQFRPEQVKSVYAPPKTIVRQAAATSCRSIAYTYTEPVIFAEYMRDCALAGNAAGIRSVMISNGFMLEKPLRDLCKLLAAVKVDLKAFTETFYRDQCGGALKPVLDALRVIKEEGTWLEIVVLVIPTLNDSADEIKKMSGWIVKNLGPDVPIHFTRFSPSSSYLLKNLPATPIPTLERARKIAQDAGLRYVYAGNVWGHPGENTSCPTCGEAVIIRRGYTIHKNLLKKGACAKCGQAIPGVWS